jgi:hypothetical protein
MSITSFAVFSRIVIERRLLVDSAEVGEDRGLDRRGAGQGPLPRTVVVRLDAIDPEHRHDAITEFEGAFVRSECRPVGRARPRFPVRAVRQRAREISQ